MEEDLDNILQFLCSHKSELTETDFHNSGLRILTVCESLGINIDNGEDKIYSGILLNNGYIEPVNPITTFLIRISSKGVDFILKGGYQNEEKEIKRRQEMEDLNIELVKSSLSMNKWSKHGILLSIILASLSLIVSIISIIINK